MKHLYFALIVLLLINNTTHAAQTAADQKILMQSFLDEIESAMKRGDEVNAKALAKQAYAEIPRYAQLSDAEKATALSEIDHVINPSKKESKREAALVEKERSILNTWLNNVRNVFDEKQALDLYERAKRDAAKFKHMSKEEIDRILEQIEDQVKFLAPVAKSAKKPGQEQKKEAQKNAGLRDEDAIKKAVEKREKLSHIDRIELNEKLARQITKITTLEEQYFKDIEALLEQGADPNYSGEISYLRQNIASLIVDVLDYKSNEFIEKLFLLLKKYGFDFNAKTSYTGTLLTSAAQRSISYALLGKPDFYNAILLLLKFGANPNAQDGNKDASLHMLGSITAYSNAQNLELVKNFIAHGADINLPGYQGMTPLHRAIGQGNFSFAHALMHFDANPYITDDKQQTPLQFLKTALKETKTEKESAAKNNVKLSYDPDKEIQRLEEFKKELEIYMKDYKKRHAKEIAEGAQIPVGVGGIVAEYMFGEDPKTEKEEQ